MACWSSTETLTPTWSRRVSVRLAVTTSSCRSRDWAWASAPPPRATAQVETSRVRVFTSFFHELNRRAPRSALARDPASPVKRPLGRVTSLERSSRLEHTLAPGSATCAGRSPGSQVAARCEPSQARRPSGGAGTGAIATHSLLTVAGSAAEWTRRAGSSLRSHALAGPDALMGDGVARWLPPEKRMIAPASGDRRESGGCPASSLK